ncbi:MAG TPA: phosphate ABC transporter substrate-binding protein PstS [Marmoricola sp.]
MRENKTIQVRRNSRRILTTTAVAAVLGVAVSACGASNETADTAATKTGGLSGTLNGAGSSAQQAAQDAWRSAFQQANSGVTINYDPSGSGAGREQFISGGSDFAGSDSALDASAGEIAGAKKRCGADAIEVPDYVSPIAVVYNVPGVSDLKLDAKTLAEIFAGKITTWDDPAIAALNKGKLPSTRITPVHRSDSSGTTDNFTDYLHQAGQGAWTAEHSSDWPLKSGEGANQTSGMVAAVKAGAGTIAYVDNSQAGDLQVASIKVGKAYVKPSAAGAAKALSVSPLEKGRPASDMAVAVDRATTEPGAYPLMLTSYLIACPTYSADKVDLVKGYLASIVSAAGQQAAAQAAGSAPLPANLQKQAADLIDSIKAS